MAKQDFQRIPPTRYQPQTVPPQFDQIFLANELLRISLALEVLSKGDLPTLNVAPEKPRDGNIAFADGTNWNPGSGAGFYGYHSGGWQLLG